jgi:predicted SnoaL-like aldol condensation-catalyzing enzyme
MSSEENKRIARRVLQELFEEGNLAAAEELIRPDFVDHEAPPDNPQGPEGLKEVISWLRGCGARCEPRSRTRSAMATRSSPA